MVVGVGGGIAAYKAAALVRFFSERGHDVRVIPTANALRFIGAATFEALSGNPVATDVFDRVDEVQHVRLGQEADLIVIAPGTADLMARLAAGRADDLLTSSCLVATCPVVIAPAMHTEMWEHPATQRNVATLRSDGLIVLEPAHGRLTGTDTGPGRMLEPQQIGTLALTAHAVASPERRTWPRDLEGLRVVISAGGTREPLDPVRFLGNQSSGRQGYALADIAVHRGAEVTLIRGSVDALDTPAGAQLVAVSTAEEMHQAVLEHGADADIIIMAAAVADFRAKEQADSKVKKAKSAAQAGDSQAAAEAPEEKTIELVENPDILKSVVEVRQPGQFVVGFAAETGDDNHTPLDYAVAKFLRKGCDLLMANTVGEGKVFGQESNSGWLLSRADDDAPSSGEESDQPDVINGVAVTPVPEGTKYEVAFALWDRVVEVRSNGS